MSASQYRGLFAECYDLFHSAKPYQAEAAFVGQCLQAEATGRRVLELACGTGGHAFCLERLGYDLTATDLSADMISLARAKKDRLGSRVRFSIGDMTALDLQGETFDAVVALFDSIGYVVSNEGLLATLRGVHRHLRPGGVFVFEFWHAAAMVRHYDPVRVRRWLVEDGEVLRISETSLDIGRQLSTIRYSMYWHKNDGSYSAFCEDHRNRYFSVPEMAGWMSRTGFEVRRWCAGFSLDSNITDTTWHVLGIVKKTKVECEESVR